MYRWVDHTGELELRVEAATREAVFEEALAAVGRLLRGDVPGEPASADVSVEGSDAPTLFAAWIGELAFLAETRGLVPERATELAISEAALQATVEGRIEDPPHLIKAVTYHGLTFERENGTWVATAVLDV